MKNSKIISLIGRIREKANKFILQELEGYGIKDLAPTHGGIIASLHQQGELTMKELAQQIDRDKSTVTALVAKLIILGYVRKRKDVTDSRVYHVSLTEKGKKLEGPFKVISQKLLEKTFKTLDPEEQELVEGLLKKISDNW